MKAMRFLIVIVVLSLLLAPASLAAPPDPGDKTSVSSPMLDVFQSVSNSFIRIDAANNGQFVVGTTGGDPSVAADDNKRLIYGFYPDGNSSIWSSFTSVRVTTGTTIADTALNNVTPTQGPTSNGSSITTLWTVAPNIRVVQVLTPLDNPYSGRADTVKIQTTVTNQDSATHGVGVRAMLDVMVGGNDAAPYFVPSVGNSNKEQQFTSANMPPYYFAFESSTFDAASLKGQGLLTGFGMTTPDRFVIANWASIDSTVWDYTIDPLRTTGDSATAMYWNPKTLAPGQSASFVTAYGLAGAGGGLSWISAPATVPVGTATITATLWVNNTTVSPFGGGVATISLPPGMTLHTGETASKSVGTVASGSVKTIDWGIDLASVRAIYNYSATTTFTSGSGPLVAPARLAVGTWAFIYLPMTRRQ